MDVTRIFMFNAAYDRIAVLLRAYKNHKEFGNQRVLVLPGGKVDPGESIIAGARRECMEEIGIDPGYLNHAVTLTGENERKHHFLVAMPKSDLHPLGYTGTPRIKELEKFSGPLRWIRPTTFGKYCRSADAIPGANIEEAILAIHKVAANNAHAWYTMRHTHG